MARDTCMSCGATKGAVSGPCGSSFHRPMTPDDWTAGAEAKRQRDEAQRITDDIDEGGEFVIDALMKLIRARDEARAEANAAHECDRIWSKEFDKDDDPHAATARVLRAELVTAKGRAEKAEKERDAAHAAGAEAMREVAQRVCADQAQMRESDRADPNLVDECDALSYQIGALPIPPRPSGGEPCPHPGCEIKTQLVHFHTKVRPSFSIDPEDYAELSGGKPQEPQGLRTALVTLREEAKALRIPEMVPEAFKEAVLLLQAHISDVAALAAPPPDAPGEPPTWTLKAAREIVQHQWPHIPQRFAASSAELVAEILARHRPAVPEEPQHSEKCDADTCLCFRSGLSSTLAIRCSRHYAVARQNKTERGGGECGGCIAEERDEALKRIVTFEESSAADHRINARLAAELDEAKAAAPPPDAGQEPLIVHEFEGSTKDCAFTEVGYYGDGTIRLCGQPRSAHARGGE